MFSNALVSQKELISQKINTLVKEIEDTLKKETPFAIFIKEDEGIPGREIEITRETYLEFFLKAIADDLSKLS